MLLYQADNQSFSSDYLFPKLIPRKKEKKKLDMIYFYSFPFDLSALPSGSSSQFQIYDSGSGGRQRVDLS